MAYTTIAGYYRGHHVVQQWPFVPQETACLAWWSAYGCAATHVNGEEVIGICAGCQGVIGAEEDYIVEKCERSVRTNLLHLGCPPMLTFVDGMITDVIEREVKECRVSQGRVQL